MLHLKVLCQRHNTSKFSVSIVLAATTTKKAKKKNYKKRLSLRLNLPSLLISSKVQIKTLRRENAKNKIMSLRLSRTVFCFVTEKLQKSSILFQ